MRVILIFLVLVLFNFKAVGQFVQADFLIPSQVCLNEKIETINSSANANHYEWDTCQGDLSLTPIGSMVGVVPGSSVPTSLDVVYDGFDLYGFVTSYDNNSIIRVKFGVDIGTVEETVNLGNIGSLLDRPGDVKIVTSGGKWYGFVYNQGVNVLCRIDFGASLTNNSPTATILDNSSTSTGNQGLDVIRSGSTWYVVYTLNSQVGVLRLNTIESVPSVSDKLLTPDLSGSPTLADIKLLSQNGLYYAYTASTASNKLYRLSFGANLFSLPVEDDNLSSGLSPALQYYGLDGGYDAGKYYLFLVTIPGSLIRVNLGSDLSQGNEGIQNLGDLGVFTGIVKNKLIKQGSTWYNVSVQFTSGNIYKAVFPSPICQALPGLRTSQSIKLSFSSSGTKYISLRSSKDGEFDEIHKSITISSANAPIIDFTNHQVCVDNPIEFSLTSDQTLVSQNWNFGDNGSSNLATPAHKYAATGDYEVTLSVSTNDCHNFIKKSITVYNPPTSSFDLPSNNPLCTNQNLVFNNTSSFDNGSNPTWKWYLNDTVTSTDKNPTIAFVDSSSKTIKLESSINGCTVQSSQIINTLIQGPLVNFSFSGICHSTQTQFTDQTVGSVQTYGWNFNDGRTSSTQNPQNTFMTPGDYSVTLTTTNAAGCNNTSIKTVSIKSQPQPNFSLDLPPFSCSGTPSQFNDLTPGPIDSNLSSWAWNFGDAGTSTDRNPLHTFTNAGDYYVSLTATTNFGCSGSFQKSVNIAASPPADFTYTPSCINQGTRFTDASGSGVKSWLWTIGSGTYAFSNPTHVFSSAGNYSAKLTVTGNNNCVATVTKTINVPVAPPLSFSVDNACETQPANFKDTSPANIDPSASWSWDFAGQGTSTGNATQYSFAKAGSYAVKMTSTQQSGCVYSLSKNVVINTTPVAAFTSSPEWGVPPLSVQFTNTSTGASSYTWHFNDKNNSTSTQTSPGFQFTELGDYVVDLVATSALGCFSSTSGKISVIIPSLDLELKQLQLVKDPTSNVYRIFVTVKNKSNYLLTSVDVVVDISGNALIKETINTNLLPDAEIVQLLNNQILPHGNLLTYLCASIEVDNDNDPFNNSKCEPVEEETVLFAPYPNPSNGTFRFEWISPATDNAHFEIFNSMGQLTFEQYAETVQVGLNQMQFDLNNLNTGAYYLRFTSNSVSKTLPIQIVR